VGAEAPSLLSGVIVDADGDRMTPTHAAKGARRYRYYVSSSLLAGDRSRPREGMRVPAGDVEGLVIDRLRAFFSSTTDVVDALAPLDLDAHNLELALRCASKLSERWLAMPSIETKSLVQDIVEAVTAAADRIEIRLSRAKIAAALRAEAEIEPLYRDPLILSIEARLRRSGKGKRLIIENGAEVGANAGLAGLIAEAFRIRSQLLSGSDDSIEAMIERLGMDKGRIASLFRLSYLAPDIVRALLEGRQPIELTPTRLRRLSKDLPHDWREQRRFLGFSDRES